MTQPPVAGLLTYSGYEGDPRRESLGLQSRLVEELPPLPASGAGLETGEVQAENNERRDQ